MTPVHIIITGCRSWPCTALASRILPRLLARHGPALVVVHGAAPGVDAAFADACQEIGVDHEPHPARWRELGARAGPIRNAEMVAAGAVLCLAVHRDLKGSKGTRGCVKLALAAGIPVWAIDSEDSEPRRITEI